MSDDEHVDHPAHYNQGEIEAIDAIEDWGWGEGFNRGNAVKYIQRAAHKGTELRDLEKARWYVNREIARLEKLAAARAVCKCGHLAIHHDPRGICVSSHCPCTEIRAKE